MPLIQIIYNLVKTLILIACFHLFEVLCIEVTTKEGILSGVELKNRNGSAYSAFYGIPFAEPPIDNLRFEPPQPPNSWTGIRKANVQPSPCMQALFVTPNPLTAPIMGSEDCLYLNVYSANIKANPLLPVLVFIHGGGFDFGFMSLYDPVYFMDYPVVVVLIQYRLNIFGFASAADDVLPGNNGLKDQVAGLKWIQNNIAAFGGDPNRVTIMGESAGSASVNFHMYSKMSAGLFHRGIGASGSALAVWAHTMPTRARENIHTLASLLHCPRTPTKALVECLRGLPAETIMLARNKFRVWGFEPVASFMPTVEKSGNNAFLDENPWKAEWISNVPYLTGVVHSEGALFAARYATPEKWVKFNNIYEKLLSVILYYDEWMDLKTATEVSHKIKKMYLGEKNFSLETIKPIANIFRDGFFFDTIVEGRRHPGNTYFYHYEHRNTFTNLQLVSNIKDFVEPTHGDDLFSFFLCSMIRNKTVDGDDRKVSDRLLKYFYNFISTGNPNDKEEFWKPVTNTDFNILRIQTDQDVMSKNLNDEEVKFWTDLSLIRPYSSKDVHLFDKKDTEL